MKLWRKVSVGHVSYSIYFASVDECPDLEAADGITKHHKGQIIVRDDLPSDQKLEVVCHELQHAYMRASGILEYLGQIVGASRIDAVEETLVSLQSPVLLTTFISAGWKPPKIP